MIGCSWHPMGEHCDNEVFARFRGSPICEPCLEMAKNMLQWCEGLR